MFLTQDKLIKLFEFFNIHIYSHWVLILIIMLSVSFLLYQVHILKNDVKRLQNDK